MDYTVKLSPLPQNELWSIEQAKDKLQQAFNIGIPQVKDEKILLELVKHAYQWDKNAMLMYAKIVQNEQDIPPDYNASLGAFIVKHSLQLVNKNREPLETPTILDLPYHELIDVLAKKGYSTASLYASNSLFYSAGWDNNNIDSTGFKKPLSMEDHNNLVIYMKSAIKGGYRHYDLLADYILFITASGYKDSNYTALNKLTEHIPTLTDKELQEALNNYKICAEHGSQYCMLRLGEASYYGIGIKQNYSQAYAWLELAHEAYNRPSIQLNNKPDPLTKNIANSLNSYSQEINKQIKEKLTTNQIEQAIKLVDPLKRTIETWDYEKWQAIRTPIPPQP